MDAEDTPGGHGGRSPTQSTELLSSSGGGGDAPDAQGDDEIEALAQGAKVGRFLVVERVGAGAMGVVYAAYDPKLDRKIALKIIQPQRGRDPARGQARMEREAQAMAKLSHPNVSSIFDVGVHEGQIVLAMEYLGGGTLRDWLSAGKGAGEGKGKGSGMTRGWREILTMFIEVGKGLAAAHSEGLIHRDFKPDNVLLDKNGVPKVVDFGLVRLSVTLGAARPGGAFDDSQDGSQDSSPGVQSGPSFAAGAAALTRTGAIAGTPAYMAPEQFFGQPVDARTDQFAFCVALYEALYGERPFAGEDTLRLAVSVSEGKLRPLPRDHAVPTWVRRVILRGLNATAAERWDSMDALIEALKDDPQVKRRRRLLAAAVLLTSVVGVFIVGRVVTRRRMEVDRQIGAHVAKASASAASAREQTKQVQRKRNIAFASFDALDKDAGEALWRQVRAALPEIDSAYDQAERSLETAMMLDPARQQVATHLTDVVHEHLLWTEDFRLNDKAALLRDQLRGLNIDDTRHQSLTAPGTVLLAVTPSSAEVVIEQYNRDSRTGRRTATRLMGPINNGGAVAPLPPGSYRILTVATGRAAVAYPFEIRPGERVELALSLPPSAAVPPGFVYIPAGTSWFGDADEQLRTEFLGAVPIHRRDSGAFLISRHETTYGEWIEYLNTLGATERRQREPQASAASHGSLRLREVDGVWQLTFQSIADRHVASLSEPIVYPGRTRHARQRWLQFPVAGVSIQDVESYAAWLAKTGRVPGARLCTEVEWERAARGADDRLFPHGDQLAADDANFDATYGRLSSAYGPDAVGLHPLSRSPFEVEDLAGNVLEFARSSQKTGEFVIRGGAYYFNSVSCRTTNREPVPETLRDVTTGVRICASPTEGY